MLQISNFIVPFMIAAILLYASVKGVPVFDTFIKGAADGLKTAANILPALIALTTAVGMFKASGAFDVLTYALTPAAKLLHLPTEVMPLALLRPISGSGAMVIFKDILNTYGPDSFVGRVASVMEGSTETTFYTIAVYYGAISISKTRHTLPSALTADLTGFIMSALAVKIFFNM